MSHARQSVLVARDGAVAVLTVNREDKRNALDAAARDALVEALAGLRGDASVRVAVLTGAGRKAFIAGAEVSELKGRKPVELFHALSLPSVFEAVAEFPKPTIAMVNGYCLGSGNELAMACDIRVASETAKFGQPEINLGLIPGGGATQRLPRIVGLGMAYRLIYSGQIIDAAEALRIGLVDEVVPFAELHARTMLLAHTIASRSPVALQLVKEAVRASTRAPLDDGLRHEQSLLSLAFTSRDSAEGIAAFLEKRQPRFTGE